MNDWFFKKILTQLSMGDAILTLDNKYEWYSWNLQSWS